MPSLETVQRVVSELEAEGQSVSIEKVRQRAGGSPRDISKHLQAIRSGTATPTAAPTTSRLPSRLPSPFVSVTGAPQPPPPTLDLQDILNMARYIVLEGRPPHDRTVHIYFYRIVDRRIKHWDIWRAIRPAARPDEQRIIDWYADAIEHNTPLFTTGDEYRGLYACWDRLVTDTIPRPSHAEFAEHRRKRFVEMARATHTANY